MSESNALNTLDARQVVYLPNWARVTVLAILGLLAVSACLAALGFFFMPAYQDKITATLSIAQTAAGAFAVILFVLFAERQLSTDKLYLKTDQFLEKQIVASLSMIEVPQVKRGHTLLVSVLERARTIHGGRKDIYGANYELRLDSFRMRMWIGINVKRLSVIYFIKASGPESVEELKQALHFTFSGASKLGYETNYQYVEVDGEKLISVWSTVMADNVILGNPAEQLFWTQDIAMLTQSVARTAVRHQLDLNTIAEPGPL
jgi:hypothetical protein